MGIYRRPDSRFWWVSLPRPGQAPLQRSTKIPHAGATPAHVKIYRQLAREYYDQELAALIVRRYRLPAVGLRATVRVREILDWYEQHVLPTRAGAAREREILPRLRQAFGSLALDAIDPMGVWEWIQHRAQQVSASTVNREVDLLKAVLQRAVPRYLKQSPLYGMKRLRVVRPKRRLLTRAEEARLLPHLKAIDRALVITALHTLCRLGDLLDLQWADVDVARKLLYIREPKDPRQPEPYEVPFPDRVKRELAKLPRLGPYIFQERRRARTESDRRKTIGLALARACRAAKIPYGRKHGGLTFHWATRRTGATRMLIQKADVRTVMEVGHWATPKMLLEIYAESSLPARRRAVELPGQKAKRRTA